MTADTAIAHARFQLQLALTAINLLSARPGFVRGILIKAAPGPVRDAVQARLEHSLELHRVAPTTSVEHLFGGLDTAQTLATGTPMYIDGLVARARDNALLLTAAERLPTAVTHGLAIEMDKSAIDKQAVAATTHQQLFPAIIAFDESLDDEPGVADSALAERLAIHLTLPTLPLAELDAVLQECAPPAQSIARSDTTAFPVNVTLPERILQDLTELSMSLGIDSMHAMHACLRVARAHAWLHDRPMIADQDVVIGVQLALAPRAPISVTDLSDDTEAANDTTSDNPAADTPRDEQDATDANANEDQIEDQIEEAASPESEQLENTDDTSCSSDNLQEQLIEAARAVLPPQTLDSLSTRRQAARGSARPITVTGKDRGLSVIGGPRGRPAGVRPLRRGQRACRLNVLETLKAAIPYQTLRRQKAPSTDCNSAAIRPRLALRCSDLRVTRYRQSPRNTTVFVVDASGSAAMHRLAEAKGAAQLMLAECYIRRDRVALITFKGNNALLALPPTRSLTRARRSLQGLPGGGSTPLAAGLQAAEQLVKNLQQAGEFPVCVFMTDGRGNVALGGSHKRSEARSDAEQQARRLASLNARLLFIDTAPRPSEPARQLAGLMQARYLALPRSGITALPDIVMGRA